ncbi:uncharacterized protein TNCV_3673611 [Trichonephila clavipes]|nr:uncharacterized protein TNCV_3673611 [Trichonephila clavipes]
MQNKQTCITAITSSTSETGSIHFTSHDAGRRRPVRSPSLKENILNVVPERPQSSTRAVAHYVMVSDTDCCAVVPGFETGGGNGCLYMYNATWGIVNIRRADVLSCGWWEASDHPGCSPSKLVKRNQTILLPQTFSETQLCLHEKIKCNSNNLRSLNGGGLSAFEKEDFFLLRNRSSCAAEEFHSDVHLEAVDRRAPKNPKNWQWTTEDESHFNLWDQDGRNRVRCYADERCIPEGIIERHSCLTPRFIVWGVISYHGRSNLLRIEVNINSNSYEVLPPEVVPFLQSIRGAIFQQDNARPHVAKTVRNFCSAQRNFFLGLLIRRIYHLLNTCQIWLVDVSLVIRILQLQKTKFAANTSSMEFSFTTGIQNLFDFMPRRIAALIVAHGGYTKY